MINILSAEITFSLTIAPQAIIQTLALFAGIFLLILLNTLRQIHLTNPIELLHSENVGEKPPKSQLVFGVGRCRHLRRAYYLAVPD